MKNYKLQIRTLVLICFICLSVSSYAQITVKGKVFDVNTGEALIGVNVVIAGTTTGTTTDIEGNYSIEIKNDNASLLFTFIGYQSKKITVNENSVIDVKLEPNNLALDEVVAIGYGSQKKSDLTGSVASVGEEDLQKIPVLNVAETLKGRVAGMQVSTSDPAPGGGVNIKIRGINTIQGNSAPLIVVDGYTSAGDLNAINPKDIKSIEVLKDASATAIFGARGANGVIIITTNKGEQGKAKFDLTASYSLRSLSNKIEVMNAQQFLELQNEALTDQAVEKPDFSDVQTTDWQDEVYRTGAQKNYQLTIKGGNEKASYYVSGGYLKDDGIVKNSFFERFSVRMKADAELTDWLKFNNTLYLARTISNETPRNKIGYGFDPTLSNTALTFYPHYPIRDGLGDYTTMSLKTNPVAIVEGRMDKNQKNFIYDYAELIATPLQGLTVKSTFGATLVTNLNQNYWPSWVKNVADVHNGIAGQRSNQSINWSNENIINYEKTFSEHKLNFTAAFTQESYRNEGFMAGAMGFLNDALIYYNLGGGNPETFNVNSWISENTLMSLLGRVMYNYKQRYYLTFSVRRDGSSKFADGKKFGNFPSLALAWRISEEDFLKDVEAVSNFKLRASWGKTGNYSALGDYESLVRYRAASSPAAIFNNMHHDTLLQSAMGNPN